MPTEGRASLARATRRLGDEMRPWLEMNRGNVVVVPILTGGIMTYHMLREYLGGLMPRAFSGLRYTRGDSVKWAPFPEQLRRFAMRRDMDGHVKLRRTYELDEHFEKNCRAPSADVFESYLREHAHRFEGKKILVLEDYSETGKTHGAVSEGFRRVFPGREVKVAVMGTGPRAKPADFVGSLDDYDVLAGARMSFRNPVTKGSYGRFDYLLSKHEGKDIVFRVEKLVSSPKRRNEFVAMARAILAESK